MSQKIDYYFTSISPFSWFGVKQLVGIAEKHNKSINFKPVVLAELWAVSGGVPPMQRPEVRQRLRLVDLQRTAHMRGVDINVKPAHFPVDPTLTDNCVWAIQAARGNPADFAFSLGEAVWAKELNITDEAVLADLISKAGFVSTAILSQAKSDEAAAARAQNSQDAIAADVVGAPAYVYKGEAFWGQDRLDYLDHMLTSGRDAFIA